MRTRNKVQVYKKFIAGKSVEDLAALYGTTTESMEEIIREGSLWQWTDKHHLTQRVVTVMENKITELQGAYNKLYANYTAKKIQIDKLKMQIALNAARPFQKQKESNQ